MYLFTLPKLSSSICLFSINFCIRQPLNESAVLNLVPTENVSDKFMVSLLASDAQSNVVN